MLFNDQRTPQGDHHQRTQQSAKNGKHQDRDIIEILLSHTAAISPDRQEQETRKCERNTGCNTFTGRTGRLNDIVFENGCPEKTPADGDGNNGNRNRCAYGKARFQRQVHRRGAKQASHQATHNNCPEGKFFHLCFRGYKWTEDFLFAHAVWFYT